MVTQLRYLGVILAPDVETMLKIAIKKCQKYLVYFEKRLDVGAPPQDKDGKVN